MSREYLRDHPLLPHVLHEASIFERGGDAGLRHGVRCTDEENGCLMEHIGDALGRDDVCDAEAAQTHAFGDRANGDSALPHAGKRHHADILVAVEYAVLKALVNDAEKVVPDAEVREFFHRAARVHRSRGVVGVGEHDHFGFRRYALLFFKFIYIQIVAVFLPRRHHNGTTSDHRRHGKVVRVGRDGHHDFVVLAGDEERTHDECERRV